MKSAKPVNPSVGNFAAEIKESLLANINHALRTPLNGLVGMTDLLAKTGLNDQQTRYVSILRESSALLMLQLENIMVLAAANDEGLNVTPEPCHLETVIKEALQPHITSAVKRHIPLSVDLHENIPAMIMADTEKLKLILSNLLACSLKFAERGKIVLKIMTVEDAQNEGQYKLRFIIENSKILYDTLHSAIEQYKDLENMDLREFGEIAVSLMTVQKLLNAMDSTISYDNMAGNEPPFHFDLALVESKDKAPVNIYEELKHKRALIFQDDIIEMNMLTHALQLWDLDYRVINDENVILKEIEEAYREGRPYNLLFCEHVVPGMHLAEIKKQIPDMILTSHDQDINPALRSEFAACLHAPVYPEELLATLLNIYAKTGLNFEPSISTQASQHIHSEQFKAVKAQVLLVEDDFVSRLYAAELLEGFGCEVATAENGQHALSKLETSADYDVIFMDCMMPRLDGYSTTQQIRKNGHTDIPIIALTANTLEQDEEKCLAAGMNDYIAKPVKEKELYAALIKHLKA